MDTSVPAATANAADSNVIPFPRRRVKYLPTLPGQLTDAEYRRAIDTYSAILDRVDHTGYGQFTQTDIADDLGTVVPQVAKGYKTLQDLGLIVYKRGSGWSGHPSRVWVIGNPAHIGGVSS
jgi:hypothetical protein